MSASPQQIVDAAHNAVAVASIAYQQEVIALTHILATAHHRHGLTLTELRDASGLSEDFIVRLLTEAG